ARLDLGARLAKAEEELARAAEASSALESAEEVPPVIGLDEPKPRDEPQAVEPSSGEQQGIAGGEPHSGTDPRAGGGA
ncbi:MAG: hypothetical protein ACRDPK_16550, partial [Carbonactinosporaceae bacterium]